MGPRIAGTAGKPKSSVNRVSEFPARSLQGMDVADLPIPRLALGAATADHPDPASFGAQKNGPGG
jgi:hypothetical protein